MLDPFTQIKTQPYLLLDRLLIAHQRLLGPDSVRALPLKEIAEYDDEAAWLIRYDLNRRPYQELRDQGFVQGEFFLPEPRTPKFLLFTEGVHRYGRVFTSATEKITCELPPTAIPTLRLMLGVEDLAHLFPLAFDEVSALPNGALRGIRHPLGLS